MATNEIRVPNNIGKAVFHNIDGFYTWYLENGLEWAKEYWSKHFYQLQSVEKYVAQAFNTLFGLTGFGGFMSREAHAQAIERLCEEKFSYLRKFHTYISSNDLKWDVKYISEDPSYILISYGTDERNRFIIPDYTSWISYTPFADYSALPLSALRQLTSTESGSISGAGSLIPGNALANASTVSLNKDIDQRKAELESVSQEMQDVEDAKTGELAELKRKMEELEAELNRKKEALLAELQVKQAALAEQKEKLERELFMLESEIYSIRCLLGETVDFLRVRKGENADLHEPIILYQKMKFLDEDLGKFSIMFNETLKDSLEEALAVNDRLLDFFLPNNKCIALMRNSHTGKYFTRHEKYENMLDWYETLHGKQLAILIRNGENVYIGWTEEEKINIRGEDFFLTPKTTVEPMPEPRKFESEKDFQKRLEEEQKRNMLDALSRYFLFSILDGVSSGSNALMPLPKFDTPEERQKHIIYSMADNWLADNRFGNFTDIIKRCNERMVKGDYLLTVQGLRPEKPYGNNPWAHLYHNDRGIGEKNRTHDVSARDCAIYPLNLVTEDKPVERIRYKSSDGAHIFTTDADHADRLDPACEIIEHYTHIEKHYYISLVKEWSYHDARANFEIYPDEVINLTYMNSVWLGYILTTKNVMGWRIGGQDVNYTYALKYIGKALDHIRGREDMERCRIDAAAGDNSITKDPDWPLHLSEWKMQNNVRLITEYQAKRFVKYMQAKMD